MARIKARKGKLHKRIFGKQSKEEEERQESAGKEEYERALSKIIEESKEQIGRMEEEIKKKRYTEWKERMKSGVKPVSDWLKKREQGKPASIGWKGEIASTREEANRFIKEQWQEVWGRLGSPQEAKAKLEKATECLTKEFLQVEKQVSWERPGVDWMEKKMKKAKGAPGLDRWSKGEIKYLPEEAVRQFYEITGRWERKGVAPERLTESKQTSLERPGKEKKDEKGRWVLDASCTRQISVFSTWWRIWGSFWATSERMAKWRNEVVQPEIVGGAGSQSAEECAAWMLQDYVRAGYAGTLDYSLCYDHMEAGSQRMQCTQLASQNR